MSIEAGTVVTAKPLGLDEARANNLEPYPDPAIPTLEGAPELVTGALQTFDVEAPWGSYTRYQVGEWDVDPTSIEPWHQRGSNYTGTTPRDPHGMWVGGMAGPATLSLALQERAKMVEQKVIEHADKATNLTYEHNPAQLGAYQPEREALHKKIVTERLSEASGVPNDRQAIIMGGLPGAGKTSLLTDAHGGINTEDGKVSAEKLIGVQHDENGVSNFMTVNSDDMKTELLSRGAGPDVEGLQPLEKAAFVHDESGAMADDLAARGMAEGKNMIFDITMGKASTVQERIDLLRANGYSIKGVFVDVSTQHSVQSVLERYARGVQDYQKGAGLGGRYVPSNVILGQADGANFRSKNAMVFDQMKPQFDSWVEIDNEGYKQQLVGHS